MTNTQIQPNQSTQQNKKGISLQEFEKRVEIEAQNLMYFNYMKKDEAFIQAKLYVSQKFFVS